MRKKLVIAEKVSKGYKIYEPIEIKRYNDGCVVKYRNEEDEVCVYLMPKGYEVLEVGNYQIALKVRGNSSSAVLVPTDKDCPGDDLSQLGRTFLIADAVKKIYKPSNKTLVIGIIVIVIIAILAIGGYMAIKEFNKTPVEEEVACQMSKVMLI